MHEQTVQDRMRVRAVAPGWLQELSSSIGLPWEGFVIGRSLVAPGERPAVPIPMNVITAARKPHYRYEMQTEGGKLAPHIGEPGEINIIQASYLPLIRLHNPTEFSYCRLSQEFVDDAMEGLELKSPLPQRNFAKVKDDASRRILGLLTQELDDGAVTGRIYAESLAQALAVRFLSAGAQPALRTRSRVSGLPERIFRRVREKMDANLHSDLSLASIAIESGYSRTHFLRMFRAATNMTPHQYLMTLRVDRAKELLANRNANLIDVAIVCGFSSQSHLTTVFRKMVGVTPAEFRRDLFSTRSVSHS
jgi:AraC family transcriptional regulator